MKKILAFAFLLTNLTNAQLNLTELGALNINSIHTTACNDIWGYVDTTGIEYAIVGAEDGVSIVDISDPANPVEVFWQSGLNSPWRDIKTWNKHAYVTTEAAETLLILDLSDLPNASAITATHWNGFSSAHNLFIDSIGYAYIFGSDIGNGGVLILDLNADPLNPSIAGSFDDWYAHDGMVRNDTLYSGHIYDGILSVVDVTNKSAPNLLGTINTPGNFAHNVWVSDDGKYAYTTDEILGGFIGSFNVSNPSNMSELDRIQSTPGNGVVPHNTHFINNYIVTSYYRDGVVIHDVSNPNNLIEVANWDSSPLSGGGFEGCWGAYPWLPSGNIIISDRQDGLHILAPNYVRGCYLEGQVTDQNTSAPISNAEIEILGHNQLDYTGLSGNYATGIGVSGTYDVVYSKPAYFPDTIFNVVLTNGNITIQDVQLVPKTAINFVIMVTEQGTGDPLENANIHMYNADFDHSIYTNAAGYTGIFPFYEDSFDIAVGHWGHKPDCLPRTYYDTIVDTIYFELEPGYMDDFSVDQGWAVTGNANTGMWERGKPIGTGTAPFEASPYHDMPWDCHTMCFLTGNGGLNPDHDDVDYGYTLLTSPYMDLSGMSDPHINYSRWFFCFYGPFTPDDSLIVYLEDNLGNTYGIDTVFADEMASEWRTQSIRVQDFAPITSNLRMNVYISDFDTLVNVTEGALDLFFISDSIVTAVDDLSKKSGIVYPNPVEDLLYFELHETPVSLSVCSATGSLVRNIPPAQKGNLETGSLEAGLYFLIVTTESGVQSYSFVKR